VRYLNWRVGVWTAQLKPGEAELRLKKVKNDLLGSRAACIAMSTPHDQAARQSNRVTGEP
jgi:hypothetical protein